MRLCFSPGRAEGTVEAPPSKSDAHRLLIAAAFADGESVIGNLPDCDDIAATLACLRALGVPVRVDGKTAHVTGIPRPKVPFGTVLPVGESASTLRFLLPLALFCGAPVTFLRTGGLSRRPMDVYANLCAENGWKLEENGAELTVCGNLHGGEYTFSGAVSSQFVSGLLFALPLCPEDSVLHILPPFGSASYARMTSAVLSRFGISTEWRDALTVRIPGGQRGSAVRTAVEGDWSAAANFYVLSKLGGNVVVTGLAENSLQPDRAVLSLLERIGGAEVIDLSDCPDLAPLCFALAAACGGGTFSGTARLRFKESDRIDAMREELSALGVTLSAGEDTVTVASGTLHAPMRALQSHGDHRIAMALSLLLSLVGGTLDGAECVSKSDPAFFSRLRSVGILFQKKHKGTSNYSA